MYEKDKLLEAEYFYSRMIEEKNNVINFRYNLSAFLSASRSVLQYALKETKIKHGGEEWYNDKILKSPVLSFFRDRRDVNIHDEPIKPRTDCTVKIGAPIHISDWISVTIKNKDGAIIGKHESSNNPEVDLKHQKTEVSTEYKHSFIEWSGQEDIFTLSRMYLDEIDNLVKDGVGKKFLSAGK